MASVYKVYDVDGDLLYPIAYGVDFVDNSIDLELNTADSALSFTMCGDCVPEDMQVEGYVETDSQIYVIKEIDQRRVTCQLCLEALEAYTIERFTVVEQLNIATVASSVLSGTGWTVSSTVPTDKARSVQQFKKTPLELLMKIRDAWMCEIRFDTKRKVVYFAEEFGSDMGSYFINGLNMGNARRVVDGYDFYTRIYPVGKDGLTIASVNAGSVYLENHQYSDKIRTYTWEDSSYENATALKTDAQALLNDLSKPKVSYSANIRDLNKINDKADDVLWDKDMVVLQDEHGADLTDKEADSMFGFVLGDTVRIIDKTQGINDLQRIVKMTLWPDTPEQNTVQLANTILTFEDMQAKIKACIDAWDDGNGDIDGVYVHGVQAGEVVGIEVVVNDSTTIHDFDLSNLAVRGTENSLIGLLNNGNDSEPVESLRSYYKIKAKQLDVEDIFAQNITATGTITGAKLRGTDAEIDQGEIGGFTLDNGNLTADKIKIYEDGLPWESYACSGMELTEEFIASGYGDLVTKYTAWGMSIKHAYGNVESELVNISETLTFVGSTTSQGSISVYERDYTTGQRTTFSGIAPGLIIENGTRLSDKYAAKGSSDPALKHDIHATDLPALELIDSLPLHQFTWNDDAPNHAGEHWDVGFIAPELYDIDKRLAEPPREGEHGSYWSVDTFYLIGVLTKAVQELSTKVKALEDELYEYKPKTNN